MINILNVGDSVGVLYKRTVDGKEFWELTEDKINKITITKSMVEDILQKKYFIRLMLMMWIRIQRRWKSVLVKDI